jgi:pyruvate dehydrogenase E2 component (dihydrolipoamide acetyltransferase)
MSAVYRMPSLGSDMEAGTLIEWVKQPGERFAKGDVIAVVETQKGAIEVEVFQAGIMGRQLLEPGQTVPVGTPMAELEVEGATAPVGPAETEPVQPGESAVQPATGYQPMPPQPTQPAAAPQTLHRRRASPAARRLAQRLGLTLDRLIGSGPDGAIILADTRAAVAAVEQSQPPTERPSARRGLDLTAMREAIAAAMAHSKREIPHYYLSHAIDLTPASDWLARRNADLPPDRRVLMGVLFIKAVALTLGRFPELNGFDRNGRFEPATGIHVGTATAIRGGGLVAPAIHDADQLDLDTLMARLRDLVARVRAGTLRSSELADPTITVSSLGERGVDRLYGVIYPPQVAIVGFGTPSLRPWVLGGEVVARTLVTATLAADHRHSDGHRGALFLAQLGQRLQEPETL